MPAPPSSSSLLPTHTWDGGHVAVPAPWALQHQAVDLDCHALADMQSGACKAIPARTLLTFSASSPQELPAAVSLHSRYLIIDSVTVAVGDQREESSCSWQVRQDYSFTDPSAAWISESWLAPELLIGLPTTASAATTFKVHIQYHVELDRHIEESGGVGGRNPGVMLSHAMLAIMPVGDIRSARYWMPCIDSMQVSSLWDLRVLLPPPSASFDWTPSASGTLVQDVPAVDNRFLHYRVNDLPLPAGLIGFVAGAFDCGPPVQSAPTLCRVLCPRGKESRLVPVVDFVSRAFHFHNWYLTQGCNGVSIDFPFACLTFAFCRGLPSSMLAVANIVLLSMELLVDVAVIDQTWETRRQICHGLVWQYWHAVGTTPADHWLPVAIRDFLVRQQLRVFHGNNDYRFHLRKDLQRVLQYERPLPPKVRGLALHDNGRTPLEALAPSEHMRLKGVLVMNLLEQRLGRANFQRLLAQCFLEGRQGSLAGLSTIGFFKTAKRLTGKDLRAFIEQCVYSPEPLPRFRIAFTYNRTKGVVNVNVDEELGRRWHGSVLIRVHEADGGSGGSYDHVVHIDEPSHHFELPYHTKARKQRVPKVKAERTVLDSINPPLPRQASTSKQEAEEPMQSSGSPIRWLRVDPDNEWLAGWSVQQTDSQWADQLEYDRDVFAQFDAVLALHTHFSTLGEGTLAALERVILDPKAFFHIRCLAALSLSNSAKITYQDGDDGSAYAIVVDSESCTKGTPMPHIRKLLEIYAKRHAHRDLTTNEVMPRANNFDALPNYFVQCALIDAIGSVRDAGGSGRPLDAIIRFLSDFLRLNDNSMNAYSDGTYVSALLRGLALSLPLGQNAGLVEEGQGQVERYARRDRILPSHRNVVMQTIIRHYQRFQAGRDFYDNPKHHWELRRECFRRCPDKSSWPLTQDNWQLYYACIELSQRCLHDGNLWAEALLVSKELARAKIARALEAQAEVAAVPSPAEESSTAWLADMVPSPVTVEDSRPKLRLKLAIKTDQYDNAPVDDEWVKLALGAAEAIWESPDSFPFRYPVDPAVPLYYTIIKSPMDLSTLQSRIRDNHYRGSVESLLRDFRQIVDNCIAFNLPGSPIVRQAQHLARHAARELKARFPLHAKAIKQIVLKTSASSQPTILVEEAPATATEAVASEAVEDEIVVEIESPQRSIIRKVDDALLKKPLTAKQMLYLWRKLMEHPDSFWFRQPVDPVALNVPTYFEVIAEPMDLGTIGDQLQREDDSAIDHEEFVRLVLLTFDNCLMFNAPDTLVYRHGTSLRGLFLAWLRDDHLLSLSERLSPALPAQSIAPIHAVPEPKMLSGEELQLATECVGDLMAHPQSAPFNEPVDYKRLGLPTYPKVIRRPMDFGTILSRLTSGASAGPKRRSVGYRRLDSVAKDIEQVFANCYRFNGRSADISQWCQAVEQVYESTWKARLRPEGNAVDEDRDDDDAMEE